MAAQALQAGHWLVQGLAPSCLPRLMLPCHRAAAACGQPAHLLCRLPCRLLFGCVLLPFSNLCPILVFHCVPFHCDPFHSIPFRSPSLQVKAKKAEWGLEDADVAKVRMCLCFACACACAELTRHKALRCMHSSSPCSSQPGLGRRAQERCGAMPRSCSSAAPHLSAHRVPACSVCLFVCVWRRPRCPACMALCQRVPNAMRSGSLTLGTPLAET